MPRLRVTQIVLILLCLELPFVGSVLLMAVGVGLAFRMQPEHRFEDGMPQAPASVAITP